MRMRDRRVWLEFVSGRVMDGAGGAVYVCGGESKGACVGLSSVRGF